MINSFMETGIHFITIFVLKNIQCGTDWFLKIIRLKKIIQIKW